MFLSFVSGKFYTPSYISDESLYSYSHLFQEIFVLAWFEKLLPEPISFSYVIYSTLSYLLIGQSHSGVRQSVLFLVCTV